MCVIIVKLQCNETIVHLFCFSLVDSLVTDIFSHNKSPITDHRLPNMHSTSHHTIPLITHQTTSTLPHNFIPTVFQHLLSKQFLGFLTSLKANCYRCQFSTVAFVRSNSLMRVVWETTNGDVGIIMMNC